MGETFSIDSQRVGAYPRGWFVVSMSDELEAASAKKIHYFGRTWLLSRSPEGEPAFVSPCCPHVGSAERDADASIVVSDGIRCPYHGWVLGFDGTVEEAAEGWRRRLRLPTEALETVERNGMILVYFDPRGRPPCFAIPPLDEFGDPRWQRWRHAKIRLATHPREIVENVVDVGHFLPVHKNDPAHFENEFDGVRAIQRSSGTGTDEHAETRYSLEAIYYGPGYQITWMDSVVPTVMFNAHTMVDERTVDLRFGVMIPSDLESPYPDEYVAAYVATLMNGFRQDAQIWEHKVYRAEPRLCDGDGPIPELRRWYAQFFDVAGAGAETATEA